MRIIVASLTVLLCTVLSVCMGIVASVLVLGAGATAAVVGLVLLIVGACVQLYYAASDAIKTLLGKHPKDEEEEEEKS